MPIRPSAAGQPCAERVYLPTSDARLIALDAANGKVCDQLCRQGRAASRNRHEIQSGRLLLLHLAAGRRCRQDHRRRRRQRQLFDRRSNPASSAPSTSIPARCSGTGTPAIRTRRRRCRPGQTYTTNSPNSWSVFSVDEGARHGLYPARQSGARPARHEPQRQCREILLLDRRARHQHRPAANGCSSSSITISGTWTFRRSRCSST